MDTNTALLIHKSLEKLSKAYDTFGAFARLVGKSALPLGIPTTEFNAAVILANADSIHKAKLNVAAETLPDSSIGREIHRRL